MADWVLKMVYLSIGTWVDCAVSTPHRCCYLLFATLCNAVCLLCREKLSWSLWTPSLRRVCAQQLPWRQGEDGESPLHWACPSLLQWLTSKFSVGYVTPVTWCLLHDARILSSSVSWCLLDNACIIWSSVTWRLLHDACIISSSVTWCLSDNGCVIIFYMVPFR